MASTKVAQRGTGSANAEADEATQSGQATETAESTETVESTETAEVAERPEAPHRRTATVNLPFVTAEFRAPEIHLPALPVRAPDRSDLSGAVSAIRARLPSPGQAAYYAGLGALGVLEIIEWPVALAIGVGTAVAQHYGGADRAGSEQRSDEDATAQ
ncbi:MAG: hypothetical protein ACRDRV_12870 [Pseudonocardiaceae bacterium]